MTPLEQAESISKKVQNKETGVFPAAERSRENKRAEYGGFFYYPGFLRDLYLWIHILQKLEDSFKKAYKLRMLSFLIYFPFAFGLSLQSYFQVRFSDIICTSAPEKNRSDFKLSKRSI